MTTAAPSKAKPRYDMAVLRRVQKELRLSDQELATRACVSPLTVQRLLTWRAPVKPQRRVILALCQALGVDVRKIEIDGEAQQ